MNRSTTGTLRSSKSKATLDMVQNLHRKPIKDKGDNAPTYPDFKNNFFHQADLVFLPDDDGYRYALVIVDVGSRLIDARPIKTKTANTVLEALKRIYNGKILKPVTNVIGVDSGSEFQGVFRNYIEDVLGVEMKVGKPDRHTQQAIVERKNRDIGKKLFMRMTADELQTGEVSKSWVSNLPAVINEINARTKRTRVRKIGMSENETFLCKGDACDTLEQGTSVRAMLDAPRTVHDDKKLHGRFRETDIRWGIKPRTIMKSLLAPGNPPMYLLDLPNGKVDYSTAYTKNQLQVIPKDEKKPAEADILGKKEKNVQKWIIDKLISRKKVSNRIMLEVKWKGFEKTTFEPRTQLMKDAPELVRAYENSIAK